jgi:hypothetical protein
MKIRYLVITAVLATAIFGFSMPAKTSAAGCMLQFSSLGTADKISCLNEAISDLMAQIQALQTQQGTTTTTAWCYTFSRNLGFAESGASDVSSLHTALQIQNISYGSDADTIYTEATAIGVRQFQARYGLTQTGYVGAATRAELNSLYSCTIVKPACSVDSDCPQPAAGNDASFPMSRCINGSCFLSQNNCNPHWTCGWGPCVNGSQIQTQIDSNNCGMPYGNGGEIGLSCPAMGQTCTPTAQPSITSMSPQSGAPSGTKGVNDPLVTIYGSGFNKTSVILIGDNVSWVSPTYLSSDGTKLQFIFPADALLSGIWSVRVSNVGMTSVASGLASNSVIFTITAPYPQTATVTTTQDTTTAQAGKLLIPSGLTATVQGTCPPQVQLSWNKTSDATTYQITRFLGTRLTGATTYVDFNNIPAAIAGAPIAHPSFTDTTVVPGTKYEYIIMSRDSSGKYSPWDVTSTENGAVITTPTCSSTQSSITVTSPNGGESWQAGTSHYITWDTKNFGNLNVSLDLSVYNGDTGQYSLTNIANSIPNTGSYNWIIPNTNTTSKLYLKVIASSFDKGPSAQDYSDNYFTIVASAPSSTTTLATPTIIPASTTASQYIAVGSGLPNASQVMYNFFTTTSVATTITELKFAVNGSNTITNICVGSICAQPVNGVADLTGLNLSVPANLSGLNQAVLLSYAGVGIAGLTPGATSSITLNYVKYTSGSGTAIITPSVSNPTMTLVGSAPIVTAPAVVVTPTVLGSQNQIGQVTITASSQGAIKVRQINFAVGNTSGLTIISPSLKVGTTTVPGSSCAWSSVAGAITCTFNSGITSTYATDYIIAAGQSQTFNLFATISGTVSGTPSISTWLTTGGFYWDDTSTNGASGTGLTGSLIDLFPTSTYTTTYVGTSQPQPSITVTSPNGGEQWQVGVPYSINWNISGSQLNRLYLYLLEQNSNGTWTPAGHLYNSIGGSSSASSPSYTFYPSNIQIGQRKIRISNNPNEIAGLCMDPGVSNPNSNCPFYGTYIYDDSDNYFTIVAPTTTQPTITITSSSPTTTIQNAFTLTINGSTATYSPNTNNMVFGYPSMSLNPGDTFVVTPVAVSGLNNTTTNINGFTFSCNLSSPGAQAGQHYACNIQYASVQPSITVTSPNGGESWVSGSTHNITWTATGIFLNNQVVISVEDYYTGNYTNYGIVTVPGSQGNYSWTIPTTLQPGIYKVAIGSVIGKSLGIEASWSANTFTIVAPTTPVSVSCSVSPSPVQVGSSTTFTATTSGGTGSYTYSWSGACTGSSQTCSNSFATLGTQTASVTATSGSYTSTAICNVNSFLPGGCGTAAKSYSYLEGSLLGTWCLSGSPTPSAPAFPVQGGSTTWTCPGSTGGAVTCTATRSAAPTASVTYPETVIATTTQNTNTTPKIPTNMTATVPGTCPAQVNLSWTGTSDAAGYYITRFTGTRKGGATVYKNFPTINAPQTSLADTTVSSGTTYEYAMYAKDSAGRQSAWNISGTEDSVIVTTPSCTQASSISQSSLASISDAIANILAQIKAMLNK